MSNLIDFRSKKKNQDQSKHITKATQIICPCTNNIFTFSCSQNTGQMHFLLQCSKCNQAYDVTEVLVEMLGKDKKQSI